MTKDPAAPGRRCRRAPLTSLSLVLAAAGTLPAQQDAQPFAHVVGRVVDERGEPVAGAAIATSPYAPGFLRGVFVDVPRLLSEPRARTDENGNYRVALSDDERVCRLLFAKAGCQAVVAVMPWQALDGTIPLAGVVLVPGTELVGRLRTADGAPIVGARVSIESALRRSPWGPAEHVSGARSDERGFFRLPCVAPTALSLRITCAGFLPHEQVVSHTTPLDLRLAAGTVVPLRFVDENDAPIAGVNPSLHTVFGAERDRDLVSDDDGRLHVTVPTGRPFRVSAIAPAPGARSVRSAVLTPGPDEVVLVLGEREDLHWTVRVLARDDATGDVLDAVRVRALSRLATPPAEAIASADDLYVHEGAGDADVRLRTTTRSLLVEAPGHGYALVPCLPDTERVEVRLGPECVLRGTVRDASTGEPAADVAVRALPWAERSGGTIHIGAGPRTDAQGRFEIRGLPAGDHTVQAYPTGAPATDSVRVTVQPDAPCAIELELPRTLSLTLRVSDESGRGLEAGAPTPWLHHSPTPDSTRPNYFVHSNTRTAPQPLTAAGRYEFTPRASEIDGVQVLLPSRHRAGATMCLRVLGGAERAPVDLAQLRAMSVRGAIECDEDLPFEQIGLLAMPWQSEPRAPVLPAPLTIAGIDDAGKFELDLLPMTYSLHLIDLRTNIVFWSTPEPVRATSEMTLRPQVQWLELVCEPSSQDADVVAPRLDVRIDYPGHTLPLGILQPLPRVVWPHGRTRQRWLVPPSRLTLTIPDVFAELRGNCVEPADGPLFTTTVEIHEDQQTTVPVPLPAAPRADR